MGEDARNERLAENERLIREANLEVEQEALEEGERRDAELELFCACGEDDCDEKLVITLGEYEDVHAQEHRFVVVPGHENEAIERVVERRNGYDVVEKLPEYQA